MSIKPFTLRYDRRWKTYGTKWYLVYLDGVEYGRLGVWGAGHAYWCTSDGRRTIRQVTTKGAFDCIRECLYGSKDLIPALQEVLF